MAAERKGLSLAPILAALVVLGGAAAGYVYFDNKLEAQQRQAAEDKATAVKAAEAKAKAEKDAALRELADAQRAAEDNRKREAALAEARHRSELQRQRRIGSRIGAVRVLLATLRNVPALAFSHGPLRSADSGEGVVVPNASFVDPDSKSRIEIAEFIVHDIDWLNLIPNRMDVEARGLSFDVDVFAPAETEAIEAIKAEGIRRISLDVRLSYRFDRGKRQIVIDEFRIDGGKFGRVAGRAVLGGIDQIRYVEKIDWQRITIVGGKADILTRSAGQTLVAVLARAKQQSPEEVRERLVDAVRSATDKNPGPASRTVVKSVAEVFDKSMAVKLAVKPAVPVTLMSLDKVTSDAERERMLGVAVEVTPAP